MVTFSNSSRLFYHDSIDSEDNKENEEEEEEEISDPDDFEAVFSGKNIDVVMIPEDDDDTVDFEWEILENSGSEDIVEISENLQETSEDSTEENLKDFSSTVTTYTEYIDVPEATLTNNEEIQYEDEPDYEPEPVIYTTISVDPTTSSQKLTTTGQSSTQTGQQFTTSEEMTVGLVENSIDTTDAQTTEVVTDEIRVVNVFSERFIFPDGSCSTLGYSDEATNIFKISSQSALKPARATDLFAKLAAGINMLGKPHILYTGSNLCKEGAGKVPCDLLDMPIAKVQK